MNKKEPISRTSLHAVVTERVRQLIVESKIQPGERVPELQISQDLGVSRTPIREALKVLASEGLVELLPLRGAIVKKFSTKDAADMLEVMSLIETFAAQKACKADQTEIDHILSLHEKMKLLYEKGKRPAYFDLNQKIHDGIVSMANNETLSMVHATLSKRMRSLRYSGNNIPENWSDALAEHEEVAQALGLRDSKRIARAIQLHFANTIKRVAL